MDQAEAIPAIPSPGAHPRLGRLFRQAAVRLMSHYTKSSSVIAHPGQWKFTTYWLGRGRHAMPNQYSQVSLIVWEKSSKSEGLRMQGICMLLINRCTNDVTCG